MSVKRGATRLRSGQAGTWCASLVWGALAAGTAACADPAVETPEVGARDTGATADVLADPVSPAPDDVLPELDATADEPDATPLDVGTEAPPRPPVVRNPCGGEVALLSRPGEACGPCLDGLLVCDGREATRCEGATTRNACGGCGQLAVPIGGPCGCAGVWECDVDTSAPLCSDPSARNACGGCGTLPQRVGQVCADGAGLSVCQGPNEVACLPGAVNPCGGTTALRYRNEAESGLLPGDPCGPCGLGTMACEDGRTDVVVCREGERGVNVLGTCETLRGDVGEDCGCGGTWQIEGDTLACVGQTPRNPCGGCSALAASPLASCPDGAGVVVCTSPDTVSCAANALHPCGATTPGLAQVGSSCGSCGDGHWTCTGDREPLCLGATVRNACGGCGPLPARVGDRCGDTRSWQCGTTGDLRCVQQRDRNRCGGVSPLGLVPGAACGACDSGVVLCISEDAVACIGDRPDSRNACGGCGRLTGIPGTVCGLCNTGRWVCDGAESVSCEGEDLDARFVAFLDLDGDGFGAPGTSVLVCPDLLGAGYSRVGRDCDDGDPNTYPGAPDDNCDGVDNDCDGVADEDGFRYRDADGDGFGDVDSYACVGPEAPGWVERGGDCFDSNADVFPGQTDYFAIHRGDGSFDYDCSGTEDFAWPNIAACHFPPVCGLSVEQGGQAVFGFVDTVAACGVRAAFKDRCNLSSDGMCRVVSKMETQTCR